MYHCQRSHGLEDLQIQHNPIALQSSNHPAAAGGFDKRLKRSSEIQENDKDGIVNDYNLKKISHRDIERQRRQEMANLYASLRSLLPPESIKGKRSISDHMHEAVNYIKDLQKKISKLRLQKEKLMKQPNLSASASGKASAETCSCRHSTVTLNLCRNGVEILISCSPNDGVFPISRVLRTMLGEGLSVLSYLSTGTNDATFYRILSEVDDPSRINVMDLQKKLTDVIMLESTSQ